MTTNANLPAMPFDMSTESVVKMMQAANQSGDKRPVQAMLGLTKKEFFCLHHGVAETGDPELDAIIRKGNHQKAAMVAMQGILAGGVDFTMCDDSDVAAGAVTHADNLFAECEKRNEPN